MGGGGEGRVSTQIDKQNKYLSWEIVWKEKVKPFRPNSINRIEFSCGNHVKKKGVEDFIAP